jgi:hypothetical protein
MLLDPLVIIRARAAYLSPEASDRGARAGHCPVEM